MGQRLAYCQHSLLSALQQPIVTNAVWSCPGWCRAGDVQSTAGAHAAGARLTYSSLSMATDMSKLGQRLLLQAACFCLNSLPGEALAANLHCRHTAGDLSDSQAQHFPNLISSSELSGWPLQAASSCPRPPTVWWSAATLTRGGRCSGAFAAPRMWMSSLRPSCWQTRSQRQQPTPGGPSSSESSLVV